MTLERIVESLILDFLILLPIFVVLNDSRPHFTKFGLMNVSIHIKESSKRFHFKLVG